MDKKVLLWGGGAIALAAVGYMVLVRGGSANAQPASNDYYPPLVYGGGSVSGGSSDTGSTSTDNSIASVLANQLATANIQSNLTMSQISASKDIALAGYANDQSITKMQTDATVGAALSAQLGNIVDAFKSSIDYGSSSNEVVNSGSNAYGYDSAGSSKSGLFSGKSSTSTTVNAATKTNTSSKSSAVSLSTVQGLSAVKGTLSYNNGVISVDLTH